MESNVWLILECMWQLVAWILVFISVDFFFELDFR